MMIMTDTPTDPTELDEPTVPAADEWVVIPARLNGRRRPRGNATVETIRERGERFTGTMDGEWITGDDGLYYRAEFVDRVAPRGRHAEDG